MPIYKLRTWHIVFIFFICSCWQAGPGKNGILSVDAMKKVMWDMVQADEFASVFVRKDSSLDTRKVTDTLYQKVFALHQTDSASFFKSFYYYKSHPDNYKVLLDSLNALATRERENRFNINRIGQKPIN